MYARATAEGVGSGDLPCALWVVAQGVADYICRVPAAAGDCIIFTEVQSARPLNAVHFTDHATVTLLPTQQHTHTSNTSHAKHRHTQQHSRVHNTSVVAIATLLID